MNPTELRNLAKTILTPRQFECWHLTHYHGRSYRTVAYMLDLDESTVRRTAKRADQKVDRWIRDNHPDGDVRATTLHPDPPRDPAGQSAAA